MNNLICATKANLKVGRILNLLVKGNNMTVTIYTK